jgi:hypothetical protein
MLFKGSPAWAPNTRSVAEIDTAVRVRDADGREHTYILENKSSSELQSNEIAVDSEFGRRLLDRKVGEVVPGHASELAVHESTITAIDHKYVYALQASMSTFNTRFPEQTGLVGVKIPLDGPPEEQLAPMLKAVKQKAELVGQTEALLQKGMPIAALAALMGRTSTEAWRGLFGRASSPIPVCAGNQEERESAVELIKSKQHRFVLEPIALLELHLLLALGAVEVVCGRLSVVEATLEELRRQIAELDLLREGYMTLFERGGQYYRHTITAQVVAAERQRLQSLLNWARAYCDVIPAVPTVDLRPDLAAGLDRGLGHAVYDTLLAAQGQNYVLISDDFNLRQLAKSEFGIQGVWVQPLLMYATDTKRLKQDHYNRSVGQLAAWRHEFTSISAQQLLFEANRSGWKVTPQFEALVSTLALSRSDLRSHVYVCWWFLKELWRKGKGPTRSQATKLTYALLKGVDPGKAPNNERFFAELYSAAQRRLLPGRAWQAILQWYQNQQLPPAVVR